MADLAIQNVVETGANPSFAAAAAGGDAIANNLEGEKTFLHVKNGHSASQTVTVNSQKTCDMGFDHDLAVAVPAGGERLIGPLPDDRFNDSNGKVQITYSGVTALTVAALKLP